jgi:hypothetical protein
MRREERRNCFRRRKEGRTRWFHRHTIAKGDQHDLNVVSSYNTGQVLAVLLRKQGSNFTRQGVMDSATNLSEIELDMLLPGIAINTSMTDHYPLEQMQSIIRLQILPSSFLFQPVRRNARAHDRDRERQYPIGQCSGGGTYRH